MGDYHDQQYTTLSARKLGFHIFKMSFFLNYFLEFFLNNHRFQSLFVYLLNCQYEDVTLLGLEIREHFMFLY